MKIAKLIAACDENKPNQYDTETKTQWISEIEGMIVDEILNKAEGNDIVFESYDYEEDCEKKLMIPDRYCDVYLNYLYAKIDLYNAEYSRYNNSVAVFQSSYDAFAAYYRRTHMPKQPAVMSAV